MMGSAIFSCRAMFGGHAWKYLPFGLILVALVAACVPATKGPMQITEAEVQAMISKAEKASRAEDIEGIMSFLADDVEISITARGPLGSTKKTMSREDYEREVRLGMALTEEYEFKTNINSIDISPDGFSAVVEIEIYELIEMFGIKAASITKETSLIQRRGGKLRFVKINAESEIQMLPGEGGRVPAAPETL